MPFKLFNFPAVVRNGIFTEMDYTNLILLSSCSLKVHTAMKNSRRNEYDTIEHTCVTRYHDHKHTISMKREARSTEFELIPQTKEEVMENVNWFGMMVGRSVIRCSIKETIFSNIHALCYHGSSPKLFHEAISKLLLHIHGPPRIVNFQSVMFDRERQPDFSCIPVLKEVEHIGVFRYGTRDVNIDTIREFLELFRSRPIVDIDARDTMHLIDHIGLLEDCEDLWIGVSESLAPKLASQFKGHHLSLNYAVFSNSDVISYLNQWRNGQDQQDLESLEIKLDFTRNTFDSDVILREFEAKPWSLNRRPKMYNSTSKRKPYLIDCSKWLDIERKSDEKLASMLIEPASLHFVVWNCPL